MWLRELFEMCFRTRRSKVSPLASRSVFRRSLSLETLEQRALLDIGGAAIIGEGVYQKDAIYDRVGYELSALSDEYHSFVASGGHGQFVSSDTLVHLVGNSVVVDAVATTDVAALQADLTRLGATVTGSAGYMVSCLLPLADIDGLKSLSSLNSAHPSDWQTNVTSQGDRAMSTDLLRASKGLTGAGQVVGVLSDSYNNLGGAAAGIASGDLPGPGAPDGHTLPVIVVQEYGGAGTDEGRGMAEIVHDVAPGARLEFATASYGEAAFAANIKALRNAGSTIIVDDIGYSNEPFFQDGLVAQAIDTVVGQGAAYFSAAGNSGRDSYESAFRAGGNYADGQFASIGTAPHFYGGRAHNFNPAGNNDFQSFTLANNDFIDVCLEWDQPYRSVSGGAGSPNDVDVYVLDGANRVVEGGAMLNLGDDPWELFSFQNTTGATATFRLMIVNSSGPNPGYLKYVDFGGMMTNVAYATNSGTAFGHVGASLCAAVGAADYNQTPRFGQSPPIAETFSSAGGIPLLFTAAGVRLATPVYRHTPLFVAPDGGDTKFFGGSDPDGTGYPNFYGTSAAAPHAAALAALLWQFAPSVSATTLYAAMAGSAIDMGAAGYDYDTGYGLVNQNAVNVLPQRVTLNGTAGDDQLIVRSNGAGSDEFLLNGTLQATVPIASILDIVVTGGGGGNDTLTVDFTAANPLTAGGLLFDATGSASATLKTAGGAFTTINDTFTGARTGSVALVQAAVGSRTISYRNLTAAVLGVAAVNDLVISLPTGVNPDVLVGDDLAAAANISEVRGSTFARTAFTNPGNSARINLSGSGDTVTLLDIDAAFNPTGAAVPAPLMIVGGAGADTFIVQSSQRAAGGVYGMALLDGGAGNDTFKISSDGTGITGNLDAVRSPVSILGGAGSNSISISDQSAAAADTAATVTNATITGLAPAAISYSATGGTFGGGIRIAGTNVAAGDNIDVLSTLAGASYYLVNGGGSDTITIGNTKANFNGTFNGSLAGIAGSILIARESAAAPPGGEIDTINVDASGDAALAAAATLGVNASFAPWAGAPAGAVTELIGWAPAPIRYRHADAALGATLYRNRVENLNVLGSQGNDVIAVNTTTAAVGTRIDARLGNDQISISADNLLATAGSTFLGGAGNDHIMLNVTSQARGTSLAIQGNAPGSDPANRDVLDINDLGGGARTLTFAYPTPASGDLNVTGLGVAIAVGSMESVNFTGDAAADDKATVTSTTGTDVVQVTPAGPHSASVLLGGGVTGGSPGPDLGFVGLDSATGLTVDGGTPTNVVPPNGDTLIYNGNGPVGFTTVSANPDAGTLTHPGMIDVNFHDFECFRLPPAANAGGHRTIKEGDSPTFDASASYDDPHNQIRQIVSYEWDLNNDGIYDLTTANPIAAVPWATLAALGISGVPIDHTVGLRVTNAYALTGTATTVLNVLSIIAPSSSVRGQYRDYLAGFIDLTNSSTHQATWDWGDGTTTSGTVTEAGGRDYGLVAGSHTYTWCGDDIFSCAGMTYQITLTVTANGATVFTLTKNVDIKPVDMQPDPLDPSKTALVVGGTCGDDTILFGRIGGPDEVQVAIHSVILGSYKPTGHLIAFGQAGNDTIVVGSRHTLPSWLFGGDGDDKLTGGAGQNLLVGGAGADRLTGGPASDVLISGTTIYDTNIGALAAIMREWESGASYAERAGHVQGAVGGGNNPYFLQGNVTVSGDCSMDCDTYNGTSLYFGPNLPPQMARVGDRTMSPNQSELTLNLSASDPNGDHLTFSAVVLSPDALAQQAYDFNSQLRLRYLPDIDNLHKAQEKWLQAANGELYALLPNGDVRHWMGAMSLSPVVRQLSPLYYADPALLCGALPPSAMLGAKDVAASVQGNQLTLHSYTGVMGTCQLRVSVSDGVQTATDTFRVQIANTAPVLADIPDQTISHRQGSLSVNVAATDADGDPLAYSATVQSADPLAQQAYDFNQQWRLRYISNIDNLHGAQEKWFLAANGQLFALLPTGDLKQWAGSIAASPVVTRFSAAYYANPALLYDARPPLGANDVALTLQGNQLVIQPRAGALGAFQVLVSANDGAHTATDTFRVQVANTAPVLTDIPDQTISHRQGSLTVNVAATDADGDPLTYSATVQSADPLAQQAYDFNQQWRLRYISNIDNLHGAQEKWFLAANGELFALLSTGDLKQWTGTIAASPVVTRFSAAYYANPALLYDARPPLGASDVTLTFQGNQLVIQPRAGALGAFQVLVSANDGAQTVSDVFRVQVTNTAPVLADISDQTMSQRQGSLTVNLAATDADGDPLTYSATAQSADPLAQQAYDFNQQWRLRYISNIDNLHGAQEKWFLAANGQLFALLSTGDLKQWTGSIAASPVVTRFSAAYYANPALLYDARPPLGANDVTLTFQGNQLVIQPRAGTLGTFQVLVSANDGAQTATDTFRVQVTNTAPVLAPINDQTIASAQASLALSATDADGDPLTYSVTVQSADPLAQRAFDLNQQLQLRYLPDIDNLHKVQEKWFQAANGELYALLPNGEVRHWVGSMSLSPVQQQLSPVYYANPALLCHAQPPSSMLDNDDVAISLQDNQLIIQPRAGISGTCRVQVDVSDGWRTSTQSFQVTVSPAAPAVACLAETHYGDPLAIDRAISQLDFGKGALLDVDALAVHLVASTAAPPMLEC